MSLNGNWSNYHALETVFNKRMSNRWQMSANWTLAFFKDGDPLPEQWGFRGQLTHAALNFPVQRDLGGRVHIRGQRPA